MEANLPRDVQHILMDALVSYSDGCTLPTLTPSCPYYRVEGNTPLCGEECRQLIDDWGAADRRIREVQIGGLVLRGRGLPLRVVSGDSAFDATKNYLQERRLPPAEQGTGSLLLGLAAAMSDTRVGSNADRGRLARTQAIWAELDRRGLPVESVVRAAILPQVARTVALMAAMPYLRAAGAWGWSVSTDALDRTEAAAQDWNQLLEAAYEQEGVDAAAPWPPEGEPNPQHREPSWRAEPVISIVIEELQTGERWTHESKDGRIPYALSKRFTARIAEWFSRLLADGLTEVVQWQAPPAALFMAMPVRSAPEEVGQWLWDRFTETHLEDWQPSSLLREWEALQGGGVPVPLPVWREREPDSETLAFVALQRLTRRERRHAPEPSLRAENFVSAAISYLERGQVQEAANIFAGLVELRPADGDARNNLGFCLLADDPIEALAILQRASLYPMKQKTINAANRVLALYLVGRVEDAIRLGEEFLEQPADHDDVPCYAWEQNVETGELVLRPVSSGHEYLQNLVAFLTA